MSSEFTATIERAESFIDYFERNCASDPLFEPELVASRKVVEMMRIVPVDAHAIERTLAEIETIPHYDGTGWHQFETAVRWWLEDQRRAQ